MFDKILILKGPSTEELEKIDSSFPSEKRQVRFELNNGSEKFTYLVSIKKRTKVKREEKPYWNISFLILEKWKDGSFFMNYPKDNSVIMTAEYSSCTERGIIKKIFC